jgi:hypothetical protein
LYKCQICGKPNKYESNHLKHEWAVHGIPNEHYRYYWYCRFPGCNFKRRDKDTVKRHQYSIHAHKGVEGYKELTPFKHREEFETKQDLFKAQRIDSD